MGKQKIVISNENIRTSNQDYIIHAIGIIYKNIQCT